MLSNQEFSSFDNDFSLRRRTSVDDSNSCDHPCKTTKRESPGVSKCVSTAAKRSFDIGARADLHRPVQNELNSGSVASMAVSVASRSSLCSRRLFISPPATSAFSITRRRLTLTALRSEIQPPLFKDATSVLGPAGRHRLPFLARHLFKNNRFWSSITSSFSLKQAFHSNVARFIHYWQLQNGSSFVVETFTRKPDANRSFRSAVFTEEWKWLIDNCTFVSGHPAVKLKNRDAKKIRSKRLDAHLFNCFLTLFFRFPTQAKSPCPNAHNYFLKSLAISSTNNSQSTVPLESSKHLPENFNPPSTEPGKSISE